MSADPALGSENSEPGFRAFVVLPRHHSAAYRHRAEDGVPPQDERRAGARQDGHPHGPIQLGEETRRSLLQLAQCGAVAAEEGDAGRFGLGAAWTRGLPRQGTPPPSRSISGRPSSACCLCGPMSLICPGRPSPSKPIDSSPSSSDSRRRPGEEPAPLTVVENLSRNSTKPRRYLSDSKCSIKYRRTF